MSGKTLAICASCIAGPIIAVVILFALQTSHAQSEQADRVRCEQLGAEWDNLMTLIIFNDRDSTFHPERRAKLDDDSAALAKQQEPIFAELSSLCSLHSWSPSSFLTHPH